MPRDSRARIAKGNGCESWRSMEFALGRHEPREQHLKSHARKKREPPNVQGKQQTNRDAQQPSKKVRENIWRHTTKISQRKLHGPTETHSTQIAEPKNPKNILQNTTPLESHHGIPSNQRPAPRQTILRPQEHHEHLGLYTSDKL